MLYLVHTTNNRYWIFSPTKAAYRTGATIKEAFYEFAVYTFNPSIKSSSTLVYSLQEDGIIYCENGDKYEEILLELPDNTTFENFAKQYPELLI